MARLHESRLPGSALLVEITERMVMGNVERAIQTLGRLKDLGVSAAIGGQPSG